MKKARALFLYLIILFWCPLTFSQENGPIEEANRLLEKAILPASEDSAVYFASKSLDISKHANYTLGQVAAYAAVGKLNLRDSNYHEAIKNCARAIKILSEFHDLEF
ncbi:MAG: hypothetical protein JKY54_04160, partial [Flavobacteriales bacterium]|nr:hypothetical protein [Flavobacteriales bacterium]